MIDSVQMTNWRAYEQREVSFGPGITFIMGANGVGKTSILEAIAYALTGEPSTVQDRAKLLRDPNELATVRLSFTVDGQTYVVERSQSSRRAENARLTQKGVRKAVASSHKAVTEQIENLMGVSKDFLQRIVYMAEGDVFRFLSQPPGKALDLQIRRVLGLTQLDEFAQAIDAAEKEVKGQIATSQQLLDQFEQLGIREDTGLAQHLQEMDERRGSLLAGLRSAQSEIDRQKRENEDLLRLSPPLQGALRVLERYPATSQMATQMPILAVFADLEQRIDEVQSGIQEHRTSLARLEGEQQAYQRILDVLQPYIGSAETVPCPVCRKPMTADEREQVLQDMKANLNGIDKKRRNLVQLQDEARRVSDGLKEQVEGLRELRNFLAHVSLRTVSPSANIGDLQNVVQLESQKLQGHLRDLQKQADALELTIADLEKERSKYVALQSRLQSLGYSFLEEAHTALMDLEIRSLSLRAAKQAVQETLAAQRNVDMKAIYAQIAGVWETFVGREGWNFQLDSKGMPVLEDGKGRQFDLSQFSGGEKTALLVILHTIIARHFSKSDFLLLDEPLEHLDSVNRRSLIRFLTSTYHRDSFNQLIITTFEESLTRKYISEEGVSSVHL